MFLPIALGSYAFALAGSLRFPGWLRIHVIGQGGSYIALVTALFVVNWQADLGYWAWAIPTLAGSPLIAWVSRRLARGNAPNLHNSRQYSAP